jgi:hypothetical protein
MSGFTNRKAFLPSFGFDQEIDFPNTGTPDPPFQITFCFKAGGYPQSVIFRDFHDTVTLDVETDLSPSTGRWSPNTYIPTVADNQLIIDFLPFLLTGGSFAFTRSSGSPISYTPTALSMYTFEINGCDRLSLTDTLGSVEFEDLTSGADTYSVSRAHYAGGKHPYGALVWATGTSGMSAPSTAVGSVGGDTFQVGNFKEFPVELENDDSFLRGVAQISPAALESSGTFCVMPGYQTIQSAQNTSRVSTLAYHEDGGGSAPTRYSISVRAYYGTSMFAPYGA